MGIFMNSTSKIPSKTVMHTNGQPNFEILRFIIASIMETKNSDKVL